jgi:hypothetical protein
MTSDELIALLYHFDDKWNSQDLEGILECFSDNATISVIPPIPRMKGTYSGALAIRSFVQTLLHGFHVESSEYLVHEETVTWFSDVTNDMFIQMGVYPVEVSSEAKIVDGKIVHWKLMIDQESIRKIIEGIGDAPPDKE